MKNTAKHNDDADSDAITQAFKAFSPVEPSAQLRRLVANIPVEYERETAGSWWPFGRQWAPQVALASMGLMGALIGFNWTEPPKVASFSQGNEEGVEIQISDAVVESEDDDFEFLFALASASDWENTSLELGGELLLAPLGTESQEEVRQ